MYHNTTYKCICSADAIFAVFMNMHENVQCSLNTLSNYMIFKIKILNKRIIYLYIITCTNGIYLLQYYHVGNQEFYDSGRSSHSRVVVNSLMSHHSNSYRCIRLVYDYDWQNRLVFVTFYEVLSKCHNDFQMTKTYYT